MIFGFTEEQIAGFFLTYTRAGRNFYAVGSHKTHAGLIGIDIRSSTLLVYAIGGMLFGLAGILLASRYNFAQNTIASGYELTIIAVAVIGGTSVTGGRGTVVGVIRVVLVINEQAPVVQSTNLTEGLMQALVATAAGLIVAIPCHAMYGLLMVRIERIVLDMEASASEIVAYLTKQDTSML